MDPNQPQNGDVTNLLDHEAKLIADMLQHFRAVALAATVRVSNRSTVGEAAANRLRMETEAGGLTQTAEDLLSLTRRIRELWVIGPLRKPGEGDAEAETQIRQHVAPVADLLDQQRLEQRQRLLGPHGSYKAGTPPPATTAAPAAAVSTLAQAQAPTQAQSGPPATGPNVGAPGAPPH